MNPDEDERWLQFDLITQVGTPKLYAALAAGLDGDFFFMHKAPGLRLRFRPELRVTVPSLLIELRRDGLIEDWRPWYYEPEERLFGGPVSMEYVHRLFTADSRAWLATHAAGPHRPGAVWAMSMLMIRSLLDAVGIAGWEDLGVWDRIERDGGRVLAPEALADPRTVRLLGLLRRDWADPAALAERLPPVLRAALDGWRAAVEPIGRAWIEDYFGTADAVIGPRRAAAFVVIFHWNRAALPLHQQALITHALAAREPGVAA